MNIFSKMSCFILRQGCLVCLLLLLPVVAEAQFIKTGKSVLQSADGTIKLVVSKQVAGIFISIGEAIPLQLFHPAELKAESSHHLFIKYDNSSRRYVQLLVGSQKYRINGSCTVEIAGLRIGIDNRNPYLSIVQSGEQESILGFHGTELVINERGAEAIALLEASQLAEYSNLVAPYKIKQGKIFLSDIELQNYSIGLDLELPRHPCLKDRRGHQKVYLDSEELLRIQKLRSLESRTTNLKQLVQDSRRNDPFEKALILQVSSSKIILLDYRKGIIKVISALDNQEQRRVRLCSVQELVLD